jgi:alpha,alpha-trehalose phosphorylase
MAAEVGHLELAHDYWGETALTDLYDVQHNTASGLHLAALAGAWTIAVAGFGGMRDHDGRLTFAPRLPPGLTRLRFRLAYRGRCLHVDIGPGEATYSLLSGEPLDTCHHGEAIKVSQAAPVTRPVPPPPTPEPVVQPAGRAPKRRPGRH